MPAPRQRRVAIHHGMRDRHRARLGDRYPRRTRPTAVLPEAGLGCCQLFKWPQLRASVIHLCLLFFRRIRSGYGGYPLPLELAKPSVIHRRLPHLISAHRATKAVPAHRPAIRSLARSRASAFRSARLADTHTGLLHLLDFNLPQLVAVYPAFVWLIGGFFLRAKRFRRSFAWYGVVP
jgi:hypothetical protein